jgi:4-hydroxybenzoate polyprenyltransferase
MPNPDILPLWKHIINESILGRRGFVKSNSLWFPLVILIATLDPTIKINPAITPLAIFMAVVTWSLFSILINDIIDMNDDTRSGKQRWIFRISHGMGKWVVVMLGGLGMIVLLAFAAPLRAIVVYAVALMAGLLYSLPPARFKERGLTGLACYSLSTACAYAIFPWSWMGSDVILLALLTFAVFMDKWVNLHFHQVIDYDADSASETNTYAVRKGAEHARATLVWICSAATLAFILLIAYICIQYPIIGLIVLVISWGITTMVYYFILKRSQSEHPDSLLLDELPWHYLGLTFALFRVVPFVGFSILLVQQPLIGVTSVLACGLIMLESAYSFKYRYE